MPGNRSKEMLGFFLPAVSPVRLNEVISALICPSTATEANSCRTTTT
jgi:hypothetical protein